MHAKGRHKPAAIVQDAHSIQAVPVFCMNLPTHHPGLCQMHALKSALDMQVEVEAPSRQRPDEGRVVLGVQVSPCAAQGSDVWPPRLASQLNTTKPTAAIYFVEGNKRAHGRLVYVSSTARATYLGRDTTLVSVADCSHALGVPVATPTAAVMCSRVRSRVPYDR